MARAGSPAGSRSRCLIRLMNRPFQLPIREENHLDLASIPDV